MGRLKQLSNATGKSKKQVIREALKLYRDYYDRASRGYQLAYEKYVRGRLNRIESELSLEELLSDFPNSKIKKSTIEKALILLEEIVDFVKKRQYTTVYQKINGKSKEIVFYLQYCLNSAQKVIFILIFSFDFHSFYITNKTENFI